MGFRSRDNKAGPAAASPSGLTLGLIHAPSRRLKQKGWKKWDACATCMGDGLYSVSPLAYESVATVTIGREQPEPRALSKNTQRKMQFTMKWWGGNGGVSLFRSPEERPIWNEPQLELQIRSPKDNKTPRNHRIKHTKNWTLLSLQERCVVKTKATNRNT